MKVPDWKCKCLCPLCRRPIPLAEVHVAKDRALCRPCGQAFSFAFLEEDDEIMEADRNHPPKGAWFREGAGNFEVGAHTRKWSFLIPFTMVWAPGMMFTIVGKQIVKGHFDWKLSLVGLPFLLIACALVPICLLLIAGHVAVRVEGEQGEVFTGVGPIGWRRRFRLEDVRRVDFAMSNWQRNRQSARQIWIKTPDRTLKFAGGVSEQRQEFLLAVLRRELGRR